jgi:hypothetical protein
VQYGRNSGKLPKPTGWQPVLPDPISPLNPRLNVSPEAALFSWPSCA